jgi:hypothetical protein
LIGTGYALLVYDMPCHTFNGYTFSASQAKYFSDGITWLDIAGKQYFIDGVAGL